MGPVRLAGVLTLIATFAGLCEAVAQPAPPSSQPASASRPSSQPASQPSSAPTGGESSDEAEIQKALEADLKASAAKEKQDGAKELPLVGGVVRTFQSLNPDISFIADIALAFFSDKDPLMVGGHDPSESGFNLQQLELAVSGFVDPYFRFDANIVFSQFGVEIEEVYATTLSLPWNLQARAGQFLTRFGRINSSHPHTWYFVDQMLVFGKFFGGEGNRGLGFELSALLPLPWYVELMGSMTDAAGESTARSFFGGDDLGVEGIDDFRYTAAVKQFFALSDDWSLFWGLSAALGPNSTGRDNRTEIYGTDLYLKYRPISRGSYTIVSLDVEWLLRRRQVPEDVLQDHGLYAYLFWRFARRWAVAARYEYVSGVERDPLDPEWTGPRQRASGNVTFWPTEFSRLRLQYNYDRPSWRAGYHGVMLGFEFAVGAHGAHKF
jgi:hypothetical protein